MVDAHSKAKAAQIQRVGEVVRNFYSELPFNFHGSLESSVEAIRRPPVQGTYPDLHTLLRSNGDPGFHVLEVGCGAGWLANGIALHYGVHLEAIDLTPAALKRARALAPLLGTEKFVRFLECNVFDFETDRRYDLIMSMGVLHHTGDVFGAMAKLAPLLKPGGRMYLGLYHEPGRKVFLEEMWRLARENGEDAAFQRYCQLDSVHAADDTLARSWFRDQVLHPHETQHTLQQVDGWLELLGLKLESTSINRFAPIKNKKKLFRLELEYEARSRKALFEENRYFPGFFTALARKPL
ncbi:MAG: class I SAM-dependent methyltransferase [Planctomycetota bacterium]|nr:class I SAM-dependent methyltransferase [Planctomycetota bacterium]